MVGGANDCGCLSFDGGAAAALSTISRQLGIRMARSFTGMSKAAARRFVARMPQANELGVLAICLHGAWRNRRFVINAVTASDRIVDEAIFDLDGLTLTVPLSVNEADFSSATRSFGAKIERIFRDRHDEFERVTGGDGEIHIVHAYHHVALCGYSGSFPDLPITMPDDCVGCGDVGASRPAHRVRYHPATGR